MATEKVECFCSSTLCFYIEPCVEYPLGAYHFKSRHHGNIDESIIDLRYPTIARPVHLLTHAGNNHKGRVPDCNYGRAVGSHF